MPLFSSLHRIVASEHGNTANKKTRTAKLFRRPRFLLATVFHIYAEYFIPISPITDAILVAYLSHKSDVIFSLDSVLFQFSPS